MGVGPTSLGHSTWRGTMAYARPQPPVPKYSRRTLSLRGLGELMGSVGQGKTHGPLGGREGFRFPGHEPRDPGDLA